jgi:sirohydrochlorin ferrochelatase
LRLDVAALRPGLEVVAANIDVQKPTLSDVVHRLTTAGRPCVVVPLLLAAGFHVRVDVADAVAAGNGRAIGTPALGPDPVLVDVLADRLSEAGAGPDDEIVLAGAGSSDPAALVDVEHVAAGLAARRGRPVRTGYVSAARPTLADAVASAVGPGRPVTVATFLLAPGTLADRIAGCGARRVSAPLAPDPRLAELVLRRYDQVVAAPTRA